MSKLSDFIEIGGTSGSHEFVASGVIGNGDVVSLNSDGTVSVVAELQSSIGTAYDFGYNHIESHSCYDPLNGKIIIAYGDANNSNFGTVAVGTITGTDITFGTPVAFNAISTESPWVTYDTTNDIIIVAYNENDTLGKAVVGTVSGTTVSFETPVTFESAAILYPKAAYDDTNNNIVIAYTDQGNSSHGTIVVGTVTGTTLTFGTPVVFEANTVYSPAICYAKTSDKIVLSYSHNVDHIGTCLVGTISGTTISFGAKSYPNAGGDSIKHAIVYDEISDTVVMVHKDLVNTFAEVVVGTVSGTTMTYGTIYQLTSVNSDITSISHNTVDNIFSIAYEDNSSSDYGTIQYFTIDNGVVTTDDNIVYLSASSRNGTLSYTGSKTVVSHGSSTTLEYTKVAVLTDPHTSNKDFIGVAEQSALDTETVPVTVLGGVSSNQSALTTNTNYFVDVDGTLTTTDTGYKLGKALSATEIIITGNL